MKEDILSGEQGEPKVYLDLGCGKNRPDGFIGVDVVDMPGVDVVHDLRRTPWPWGDSSVDAIHSSHFLEHLDGPERISFMDECWRILKPGSMLVVVVPYYTSVRAIQDPTHKWPPIAEASFLYYNRPWREANKLDHYNIQSDFEFQYNYAMPPEWANRSEEARAFAIKHYWNIVSDLTIILTKRNPNG